MSLRAIIIGLSGAAMIAGATFFNDMVMRGTFLVGNFMPVSVFGSLILFLLLINPLLKLISSGAALTGQELAVIVGLPLFACYVPGRGLMHQFTTFLMLPHHYERTVPGWQGDSAHVLPEHIESWEGLAQDLRATSSMPGESAGGRVWAALPSSCREGIHAMPDSGDVPEQLKTDLLKALNEIVLDHSVFQGTAFTGIELPGYAEILQRDIASSPEVTERDWTRLNRGILDTVLAGGLNSRKPGILEHVPPRMLADPGIDSTVALDGFVNGIAVGDTSINPADVPWHAWKRTLLFWIPLILSICVVAVGMSLVIHRQWTLHEHLPYPTVEFVRLLLPRKDALFSSIFRNRLFWLGTICVLALHMNNYACVWWPDFLIPIRIRLDFSPILRIFPVFEQSYIGIYHMFHPSIYFTVIGFAYLLATDVSLSLGIAPYAFTLFTGWMAGYGIAFSGPFIQPATRCFFYAGAYCAMFLVLLYTGRHYYTSVIKRSIGLKSGDHVESYAVWGGRAILGGAGLFILQLVIAGLEWQLAMLYTMGIIVIYAVISRLLAEAGVFYLHTYFFPCILLWGFLGAKAVGPSQLLIMGMLSSVLLIDPREAIMPFVISAIRLAEDSKIRIGSMAGWGTLALVIALAVAVPATLYLQYQHGAIRAGDGWTCNGVPKFAFDANSSLRNTLESQGALEFSNSLSGWKRFANAEPMPACSIAFCSTFLLVLIFTLLRYRFAWWPLHPLLFLVLATFQSRILAFSFFIGWVIKKAVTKYGGANLYQRLKPLMIGLVAGELLAGIIPMIVGAVYYAITKDPPMAFSVYR